MPEKPVVRVTRRIVEEGTNDEALNNAKGIARGALILGVGLGGLGTLIFLFIAALLKAH